MTTYPDSSSIFFFFLISSEKQNHSPNPLLTLRKKLFHWVDISPRAFFSPHFQSIKKTTAPHGDSEGGGVLPSRSRLSSLFVREGYFPPVCEARCRMLMMLKDSAPSCLTARKTSRAGVFVDVHNLPMDAAGQRTFSPVGGIILTAAESACVCSVKRLVSSVPEETVRHPEPTVGEICIAFSD